MKILQSPKEGSKTNEVNGIQLDIANPIQAKRIQSTRYILIAQRYKN